MRVYPERVRLGLDVTFIPPELERSLENLTINIKSRDKDNKTVVDLYLCSKVQEKLVRDLPVNNLNVSFDYKGRKGKGHFSVGFESSEEFPVGHREFHRI